MPFSTDEFDAIKAWLFDAYPGFIERDDGLVGSWMELAKHTRANNIHGSGASFKLQIWLDHTCKVKILRSDTTQYHLTLASMRTISLYSPSLLDDIKNSIDDYYSRIQRHEQMTEEEFKKELKGIS